MLDKGWTEFQEVKNEMGFRGWSNKRTLSQVQKQVFINNMAVQKAVVDIAKVKSKIRESVSRLVC
jgi:hypothetical protein